MTVHQVLKSGHERLAKTSNSPRLDAEVLLAHAFKTDRADLLRRDREIVPQPIHDAWQTLVSARSAGFPIAYLIGWQEFYGLRLRIIPEVLVPRPTTELLIDHVREHVDSDEAVTLADVGTGSGAIALALAISFPRAQILATDISPTALSLAHYNAHHLHLTSRLLFAHGSLLAPFAQLPTPDVIVANLPYLTPDEMVEPSIQHEPRLALAGGRDGLTVVRALLDQIHTVNPWRGLVLELSPHHIEPVRDFMEAQWPQYTSAIITDGQSARGLGFWSNETTR